MTTIVTLEAFLNNTERLTGVGKAEVREILRQQFGKFNEARTNEYLKAVQEYKRVKVQKNMEERFANNPKCPYHPEATTYGTPEVGRPDIVKNGGESYDGWVPGWKCEQGGLGCYWRWRAEQTVLFLKPTGYFERVTEERKLLQELTEVEHVAI
jgi:hypothetical protein